MTPEGKVKEQVRALLRQFSSTYYFMPPANGYGRAGIPDIVGCYNGLFFAVECKAPGKENTVTPLQTLEKEKIVCANGAWFLIAGGEGLESLRLWLVSNALSASGLGPRSSL